MNIEIKKGVDNTEYKVVNGTYYKKTTNDRVIEILEDARTSHTRLKFSYGDVETGKEWEKDLDSDMGYVGRSTGPICIPLLVNNSVSKGGVSILTHCVVKIEYSNKRKGGVLYNIMK